MRGAEKRLDLPLAIAACYMALSGAFSLASLALSVTLIFPFSDILTYVHERRAYTWFFALNLSFIVAGVGIFQRWRWAFPFTYLLFLASTYFSAYAVAWGIEGFDKPVDLPFFLILFGAWNAFWPLLVVRGHHIGSRAP